MFPNAAVDGQVLTFSAVEADQEQTAIGTVTIDSDIDDKCITIYNAIVVPKETTIVGQLDNGMWQIDLTLTHLWQDSGDMYKIAPADDTTGPSVSVISPIDGASEVAIDSNIEITFDESLNESTVTTDNFILVREDTEVEVSVAVSYTDATKKVVMNPASNLEASTSYMVMVLKNVADLANNRMLANYYSGFETAA